LETLVVARIAYMKNIKKRFFNFEEIEMKKSTLAILISR